MLPCKKLDKKDDAIEKGRDDSNDNDRRKLLWYAGDALARRVLAAGAGNKDHCSKYVSRLRNLSNKSFSNQFTYNVSGV